MENSSPPKKKKQWKIQMKYVDMGFDIWKIAVISVLLRLGVVMAVANVKASAESGKSTKKIRS